MHMMPAVGNIRLPSRPIAYVCRRPVPGMVPLSTLKGSLNKHWVFTRPAYGTAHPIDDPSMLDIQTSTLGDNSQILDWSLFLGGRPLQWRCVDTSDGYDVEILNNLGGQGREIASAEFWSLVIPEGRYTWNPTDGGTTHGSYDFGNPNQGPRFPGYSFSHTTQGGPIHKFISRDLGGGSKFVRWMGIPLEFKSSHVVPASIFGNGSCHEPLAYTGTHVLRDLTTNWNGNKGIHKHVVGHLYQKPLIIDAGKAGAHDIVTFHDAMGYDEVHVYESTIGWTALNELNAVVGLVALGIGTGLDSVASVSDVVTVTFSSPHTRTLLDNHLITFSGWTPSVLNGEFVAVFNTSTTCTVTVPSSGTQSFTGGQIDSEDIPYHSWNDNQPRIFYRDRFRVENSFFGPQLLPNRHCNIANPGMIDTPGARTALAGRSLATGGEAWSFNVDFAHCVYMQGLDDQILHNPPGVVGGEGVGPSGSGADGERLWRWNTLRNASTPTNDPKSPVNMFVFLAGRQQPGQKLFPAGWHSDVVYLLTGTWSEVQASVAFLDTQPDSIFDLPSNYVNH